MSIQLIVSNLRKKYKSQLVVKDISLNLAQGEIAGLLGPNGAGKTTCFYMILGFIASEEGRIHLGNDEITHLPVHARAKLGMSYLPQEPSIFRKLTVADNIMAILEIQSQLTKKDRQVILNELLEEFHIAHLANHYGYALSGGERRRVEIARALATLPKFILLDEPFAGVDPISIHEIKSIIHQLANRGIGILMTDHNVRETLAICHNATIVHEGSVLTHGTPKEVLAHKEVRKVYLGEAFEL